MMVYFGISSYFFGYPPARPGQQQHPAPTLPLPKVLSKRSPKMFRKADLRNQGNSYLMNISGMKIQSPVVGLETTRKSHCSDAQQYSEEAAAKFISWFPFSRDTSMHTLLVLAHGNTRGVQVSFFFFLQEQKNYTF